MSRYSQVAYIGILVALALVLQLFENMIPMPSGLIPGVKIGLANIITLIAIIYLGFKKALLVVLLRTFMGAFLSGRFYVFMYSGSGALLSVLLMGYAYYRYQKYLSIQGISILGAVGHNVGQILVASFVINTDLIIFNYLPLLMVSAIFTGFFIGLVVQLMKKPLDSTLLGKFSQG